MNGRELTELRRAEQCDAPLLRTCFELASHGMAPWFWEQARQSGQSLEEVALARMQSKLADPANDIWVDVEGGGAVVSYDIPDQPEPLADLPDFIRPLVSLENTVLGTRYINVLAVLPNHRRRGLGRTLISRAIEDGGQGPTTLIVESENADAIRLYESCGFTRIDCVPVVKGGWSAKSDFWHLMGCGC